ncbi:WW domain-containing adapter protein [Striga asiatica]|uniref:WW domain-containing adapter protein n=1 Tax=Striga asiatica TaxID=4170 RepID=A0A5A7PMM0_STRAF|nr:WW domain-containing adapter protein [Striga asiatica]
MKQFRLQWQQRHPQEAHSDASARECFCPAPCTQSASISAHHCYNCSNTWQCHFRKLSLLPGSNLNRTNSRPTCMSSSHAFTRVPLNLPKSTRKSCSSKYIALKAPHPSRLTVSGSVTFPNELSFNPASYARYLSSILLAGPSKQCRATQCSPRAASATSSPISLTATSSNPTPRAARATSARFTSRRPFLRLTTSIRLVLFTFPLSSEYALRTKLVNSGIDLSSAMNSSSWALRPTMSREKQNTRSRFSGSWMKMMSCLESRFKIFSYLWAHEGEPSNVRKSTSRVY